MKLLEEGPDKRTKGPRSKNEQWVPAEPPTHILPQCVLVSPGSQPVSTLEYNADPGFLYVR